MFLFFVCTNILNITLQTYNNKWNKKIYLTKNKKITYTYHYSLYVCTINSKAKIMEYKIFTKAEQDYLINLKRYSDNYDGGEYNCNEYKEFNNNFLSLYEDKLKKLGIEISYSINLVEVINYKFEKKITSPDKFSYSLILFLINRFFYFDLFKLKLENKFIDILILKFIENYEKINSAFLSYSILNELVSLIYPTYGYVIPLDEGIQRKRQNILKLYNLCSSSHDLVETSFIETDSRSIHLYDYNFTFLCINTFLNDWLIPNELITNFNNDMVMPITTNNIEIRGKAKSEKNNIEIVEKIVKANLDEKIEKDEHEDKYIAIYKILKEYTTYISPEKIKKIIQYKINNDLITPNYIKTYFALQFNKLIEAEKIGFCFGFSNDEIRHFIRYSDGQKKEIINKRINVAKTITGTLEIDIDLLNIRNDYLHKIDPDVFPLIKK